jgi:hypothetical protein
VRVDRSTLAIVFMTGMAAGMVLALVIVTLFR